MTIMVREWDGMTGSPANMEAMTNDLDASYDMALRFDSASQMGLSPGNTTVDGSSSGVAFVNVDAGRVTPTLTPPTGHTCTIGHDSFDPPADSHVLSTYYCQPE